MPLRYKIDVIDALRKKGYNSSRIREHKLLSESTVQKLREGRGLSWDNLERLCRMLDCDISDFLEFEKENTEEHK